eukprot:3505304-Rhodomonas_salina.1
MSVPGIRSASTRHGRAYAMAVPHIVLVARTIRCDSTGQRTAYAMQVPERRFEADGQPAAPAYHHTVAQYRTSHRVCVPPHRSSAPDIA